MSQLLAEERLSFSALATRQGVNVSTVWRWAVKGCRGVVLESLSIGGRRYTSEEAFGRFIESSNSAKWGSAPTDKTRLKNRSLAIHQAELELKEAGI